MGRGWASSWKGEDGACKVTGRGNWASGRGRQGQRVRGDFGQWGWGR